MLFAGGDTSRRESFGFEGGAYDDIVSSVPLLLKPSIYSHFAQSQTRFDDMEAPRAEVTA
jgi:hypothetical protein